MERFLFFLCIIFIVTPVYADNDILGWDKAKWGMTHAQINELYDIEDWVKEGGNQCKLKEKKEIAGFKFQVNFFFDKSEPTGKLIRTALTSHALTKNPESYYDEMIEFYTKKFGKPDSKEKTDTDVKVNKKKSEQKGYSMKYTWQKPSGAIMYHILVGPLTAISYIKYEPIALDNKQ